MRLRIYLHVPIFVNEIMYVFLGVDVHVYVYVHV
jgi:hypothetical protein